MAPAGRAATATSNARPAPISPSDDAGTAADAGADRDAGMACGPGTPAIRITSPRNDVTRGIASPVTVEWTATGLTGQVQVEVRDSDNLVFYLDETVDACAGRAVSEVIDLCDCEIKVRSLEDDSVRDTVIVNISTD